MIDAADSIERDGREFVSDESVAVSKAAAILDDVASSPIDVTHDPRALCQLMLELSEVLERSIEITTKTAIGVGLKSEVPLASMADEMPATMEYAPANLLDAAGLMAQAQAALDLAVIGLAPAPGF